MKNTRACHPSKKFAAGRENEIDESRAWIWTTSPTGRSRKGVKREWGGSGEGGNIRFEKNFPSKGRLNRNLLLFFLFSEVSIHCTEPK